MTLITTFHISKMDCPSEENLIRMRLEGLNFQKLEFDITNRKLQVYHVDDIAPVVQALYELDLGTTVLKTEESCIAHESVDHVKQRNILWYVLLINLFFFALEVITGFLSDSLGLVADSLDMLADSLIYGLSLYAAGQLVSKKKRIAKLSGYLQLLLAFTGLIEVIKRFVHTEEIPVYEVMMVISLFAMAGNAASLYLLQKTKSRDIHIQVSLIFTNNDVIANAGVLIAGILVFLTDSKYPDLIIGAFIFFIVFRGALRILKLSR